MRIFQSRSSVVVALLCGLYFILYIDRTNLATAAYAIKADLGLTNIELGLAFSGFSYAYLVFQIIGGWLGDRFGPRITLAASAIVFSVATIFTGFVVGLWSLLLVRVLLGIGEGAAFPVGARAQVLWVPKEKYGWSQGITHSFSRLGNAVASPLIASLIILSSWRASFWIVGVASLAWVVVWLWFYRDVPSTSSSKAEGWQKAESVPVPWWPLFVRMLPVILVDFCFAWSTWTYLNWLPSFFLNNFQMDLKNTALFTGAAFLVGVVGNTLGGVISDRILHSTGSVLKARRDVMAIGLGLAGIFLLPLLIIRDQLLITSCLIAALFCTEMMVAALWSVPMHIAPRFAGIASGMMNCGYGLAGIISPVVFGYVVDRTGDWQLPFAISVGLLFVGAVLTFWMRPDQEFVDPNEASSANDRLDVGSAKPIEGRT